jgi:hypothetical protein
VNFHILSHAICAKLLASIAGRTSRRLRALPQTGIVAN